MSPNSIPIEWALSIAGWIFALGVLVGGLGFKLGHHRMMRRFANDDAFAVERRKYWQGYFSGKPKISEHSHANDAEHDG